MCQSRNLFFPHKNLSLVLTILMTCKSFGFPDRFPSRAQPRYVTVLYCLICIVPYLILRLLSFLISFLCQTVCFKSYLQQTLETFLLSFCLNTLTFLCWYVKQEFLRKGASHKLQSGTCHLHIAKTTIVLKQILLVLHSYVSNIGVFIFDIDLNFSIRKV